MRYQGSTSAELFKFVAPDFTSPQMLPYLRKKLASWDEAYFELHLNEFLKFMYLRSLYGRGFIPVVKDVDEIWHLFILQTVEYEKFCFALPGKHFIHHNSIAFADYHEQEGREAVVRRFLDWIPKYVHHFGDFTEKVANCWLIVNFLRSEMGFSLSQINELS